MNRRITVISCGTALLITTAVVVALRERRQPLPLLEVPVAVMPTEVRVKAVGRKAEPLEQGAAAAASGTVAIVCGNGANAYRYEARNGALRSIARRRDSLPSGLVRLGRSTGDSLR